MAECSLCQLSIDRGVCSDGELQFCCSGCHSVYKILKAKNELNQGKDHPLVLEAAKKGIVSNPKLLEELEKKKSSSEIHKLSFEIEDLFCPSCQELIQWVLLKKKGIVSAHVDYATDLCFVSWDPKVLGKEAIIEEVENLGYTPRLLESEEKKRTSFSLFLRCGISAFCAINIMMFSYPLYVSYFDVSMEGKDVLFAYLNLLLSIPVLTYCAWPIYRRAFTSVKHLFFSMELLVSISSLSAFFLSAVNISQNNYHIYLDAATVLVTFVLLGRILESRAKFTAKEALFQVHRSLPKRARRENGEFVFLKDVLVGDVLKVVTGEKVALDGIVDSGEGLVDESMLTGEVMPCHKKEGSPIKSGSVVQQGWMSFSVTAIEERSTMSEMISLIEGQLAKKGGYKKAVDAVLKVFVPLVLCLALGLLVFGAPIERVLALLLICCPCAIGVAAPLAESYLMHSLLGKGILIRHRRALSVLGNEDVFAFDKTGTITEGRLKPTLELKKPSERAVLKKMCQHSIHPIAQAVSGCLEESSLLLDEVEEVMGKGILARWSDKKYYFGSLSWMEELGFSVARQGITSSEQMEVYFMGEKLLPIPLTDRLREDVLSDLKNVDTYLLSGDQSAIVQVLGKKLHFTEAFGGMDPLEKQEKILSWKKEGKVTAMVGDGINDAPALASADLSVSILGGSDLSLNVSDVVIMKESLKPLITARKMAVKGRKIIRQNLLFSFSYNGVGIVLAMTGYLHPLFSALAMICSSLFVTLNSRRLCKSSYWIA